jgi:hypothetical protein
MERVSPFGGPGVLSFMGVRQGMSQMRRNRFMVARQTMVRGERTSFHIKENRQHATAINASTTTCPRAVNRNKAPQVRQV